MNSMLANTALRSCKVALSTLAMAAMVTVAHADLITNGNFSSVTINGHSDTTTSSELSNGSYSGAVATGWSNTASNAYNFVFVADTAGKAHPYTPATAANSSYGTGNVTLTNNPGGNFLALDSDYPTPSSTGAVTQVLTGLTSGVVTLTFDVAADQQNNHSSDFDEYLAVTLGGANPVSSTLGTIVYNGTTSWTAETLTFDLTSSANETLSFLAYGGPSNAPSFVLLDNVSATEVPSTSPVPEPGSLALLSTGLLGLGGLVRSRFNR